MLCPHVALFSQGGSVFWVWRGKSFWGRPPGHPGLLCAQYLLHLPCAVSSGSQEDHTKSIKKTQRGEEDIVSCVVIVQFLEHIQTKFNICCAEGIHFRQSLTWEWKGKKISDLPGGTDYIEHSVMTFRNVSVWAHCFMKSYSLLSYFLRS